METFNLKEVPQEQLVAYYGLCFAAASADGRIEKEEKVAIFEMLDLEPLDEKSREEVHSFILSPPSVDGCINKLSVACSELRYSVIVALVEIVFADDVIEEDEKKFLSAVCDNLRVTTEQLEAIINFVKEARRIAREGLDNNAAEKALKNAASALGAVGVPIAAVYFSGTVIGLSAAGITSGLAALGLGLGMVPGIGVAILIGTGVFIGAKKLFGDSKEKKESICRADRERKAQLVIKNLQDCTSNISKKIESLKAAATQAELNKEAIGILSEQLTTLKRVLAQKKASVSG
jgi:uncharacterized tellurite resistance protein B-like protein